MLADQIAYVALVSHDPAAAASVFERHFRLPRRELSSAAGPVPVLALGRSAFAMFPPGHPLVEGETAIARFVASQGRGLHHVAVKSPDIDALLGSMAAAGLPMIDTRGRPGSRRALIGFPHPRALGGVLMHLVQRPD